MKLTTYSCLLAVFYYFAAKLGLSLAFEQANTSPVWPPTGLAIAAVLYFGRFIWPGIFVGAFAANLATGLPVTAALGIGVGNTLEAVIAGYLIQRFAAKDPFTNILHTSQFLIYVVVATATGATIGVSCLLFNDIIPASMYGLLWKTWWLGDLVGGLVLTPFLLTWVKNPVPKHFLQARLEAALFGVVTVFFIALVFTNWINDVHTLEVFLLMPLVAWASIRFHDQGATLLMVVLSSCAIAATHYGMGPFLLATENESLLFLQATVGAAMVTVLLLVASQEERLNALRLLTGAQQGLEAKVAARTQELHDANKLFEMEAENQRHLTSSMAGLLNVASQTRESFFKLFVQTLAETYQMRYAGVGVFADDAKKSIKTLAFWDGGQADNIVYDLQGTPCEDVLNAEMELVANDACKLYPDDQILKDLCVYSYFGVPLVDNHGEVLGVAFVMDTKSIQMEDWIRPVLGLFADRAVLELNRCTAQNELELSASVFKESADAIVICSADKSILRVNPAFIRMTGYDADEVIGREPDMWKRELLTAPIYQEFWQTIAATGIWQGEVSVPRKNGTLFSAWQTVSVVSNNEGDITQYISIFSDITEEKLSQERIYDLAHNDVLTGLPNRTSFQERVNVAIKQAEKQAREVAVVLIDLDHFKLVNDTAGHPVGDLLLGLVAERLKSAIRKDDLLSRFGGDEFTLLIPDVAAMSDINAIVQHIIDNLASPFFVNGSEFDISASIGIGLFPQDGSDAAALIKSADIAMYQAKAQGRNNYQFFAEAMNREAQERIGMARELRRAIELNQFVLYFQPQIDVLSDQVIGFEALIRWVHPERGLVPPDKFIAIAEMDGLIVPIGNWVIEAACQQCACWKENGYESLKVAVNLSSRQFADEKLVNVIEQAAKNAGISASDIELEITEGTMMENTQETVVTLNKLRAFGMRLSIDDFGTGYSSLSYLKRFPIDKLKIDRSFIIDLPGDKDGAAIVGATVAMARSLGLSVIAEGVETQEQLDFITAIGCNEIQGYFYSKPIPGCEVLDFLALKQQQSTKRVEAV